MAATFQSLMDSADDWEGGEEYEEDTEEEVDESLLVSRGPLPRPQPRGALAMHSAARAGAMRRHAPPAVRRHGGAGLPARLPPATAPRLWQPPPG
jgi:hypothetical protein